eukprot:gnl/MRDRNA2_/MRDRNA2_27727_c0_seq1.p1 gnl/MRDRNA2_/MRDRNA2_27727_c0~~gnl/MRDRNA2_/MRDRNA2_27727_c0_seq1.p1  ORF type:complete len:182 (-),score=44.68 gnl/MRDRNA2_/MRDRNA2_27727_c0_seq1:136-681(-)
MSWGRKWGNGSGNKWGNKWGNDWGMGMSPYGMMDPMMGMGPMGMMDPSMMMMMGKGGGKGSVPFHQLSRGKACVEFSTAAEARAAISSLNGSELDKRSIKVSEWTKGKSRQSKIGDDDNKVYVANLNWRTRNWKLKQHFSACGTVKYCAVIKDTEEKNMMKTMGGGKGGFGKGGWGKKGWW